VIDDIQDALVIAQDYTANQAQQDALTRVQDALTAAQAHHAAVLTKKTESNTMYGQVAIAAGDALLAVQDAQTAKTAVDVIVGQVQALANAAGSGGDTAADNVAAQNAATLAGNYATEAATQAANVLTSLGNIHTLRNAIADEAAAA
jgi:hypothetical protein